MDFKQQPRAMIGAVVGGVVLIAISAYWLLNPGEEPPPATIVTETPPPATPPPEPEPEPEPEPPPFELPLLSDSDAVIRELLSALSTHPVFASWLITDDLIRRLVVVVENVANGNNPAQHVPFMQPSSRFAIDDTEPALRISPASYARYDSLAATVASLDVNGTAQLYRQLLPLMNEAYTELGIPDSAFPGSFQRAITHLLEVPIIEGRPIIEPRASFFYEYTDPDFQNLSAAQKQFLGMGPDNVRIVQGVIREIASVIGISDLPAGNVILR